MPRYSYAWRKGRAEDLVRACHACERCHRETLPAAHERQEESALMPEDPHA